MTTPRPLHLIPLMLIMALLTTSLPHVSHAAPPQQAAVTRLELLKTIGKGHVTALAYRPDGEQIAVAGGGGAYLYDADALQPRHLDHDYEPVRAAAYTPDGRHLVTLSQNADNLGTVWVWDTTSGDLAQQWLLNDLGLSLAISPDGQRATIGTDAGEVQVWSLPDVTRLTTLTRLNANHTAVTALAFSPDGQSVLGSIGYFGPLWVVWDVETGDMLLDVLGPHRSDIRQVAYSADGANLFTQSDDIINIWDSATGRLLGDIPYLGASILSMALSPDGQEMALALADNTIRRWSLATKSELPALDGITANALAYSPDSRHLVSAAIDGPLLEWDLALPSPAVVDTGYFSSAVVEPTLSPDGRTLGIVFNTSFWLWDVEAGGPIARLKRDIYLHTQAAFNPTSDLVALTDRSGVDVYRVPSLEPVLHIDGLSETSIPVGATFDTTWGALLVGFRSGDVVRYSLPDGTPTPLASNDGIYTALTISPDGQQAAGLTSNFELRFWNTINREPTFETTYTRTQRIPMAFSQDSQLVATTTSTSVALREADGGASRFIGSAIDSIGAPVITPNNRYVVVLFDDTLTLYDQQGQKRYTAGFPMGVVWAAFDSANDQFWTLGEDHVLYVWQYPIEWR